MIPRSLSRRDLTLILLAALSVAVYIGAADYMGETGFPLDDAWIHQTYARSLAETGQWAFVPGEPSAGSTAPLYTLLLSAGYIMGLPFLLWAALLGTAALSGAGLIAARLAERLAPEISSIGWWAGLATVMTWHLVWAAASGMETILFAALTLALVAVAWRELDAPPSAGWGTLRRGGMLGLLGALTMLARPEGAGLLGLIGLLMWIARPQGSVRGVLVWSCGVAAGWLAGFVPYVLLNTGLGGGILPNTASAKQAEYAVLLARSYPRRIANLLLPLLAGGQVMLLPGMAVAGWTFGRRSLRDRRAALLLVPILWALALVGLYAARLPATYQHGRYVMPALPHLILYGVVGTAYLVRAGRWTMVGRVGGRALALAAATLFVVFWGIGAQQYARDVQIIQSEMVATARWLADHVDPADLLAVHDIGALGYYAPRPILDLAGLVSPEVIPIIRDGDALWALMEARGVLYLMAMPDQVPGGDEHDPRLCPIFSSGGEWAPRFGGRNMTVYALAWDGRCT